MTRVWRNILAISAAVVIPLGFFAYFSIKLLTQICYKIHAFKIKNIGNGNIDIVITLIVNNPSNINIKIEGYSIDVKINNEPIATVKSDKEKILYAKDDEHPGFSLLDIPVTISYDKFVNKVKWNEILSYFISGKTDKIFVNLDGKFLGAVAKIPVSTSIKLNYSVAEIMKMIKEPSTPCVTGKVKKDFKLLKK